MLPTAPPNLARRLRVPGYLILVIAFLLPLQDFIVQTMPLRPAAVVWRFGFLGLLSSAIGAPLLILFFIYVLALMSGDRKIMILVVIVAALMSLTLLAGSGAFALDALQMKRRVQAAAQMKFTVASMQATAKLMLQGLASLVLAVNAFGSVRTVKAAAARADHRPSGAGLIMGRAAPVRTIAPEVSEPAHTTSPADE